ncbi:hypothetical protein [Streptomyces sp. 2P-4]|uniref:ABC transporter permease n=1 Tax=unclassified Streptomyces TaxID=2593676 RepID=UPI00254171F2|nr:hypothetical protein [Streptomyces sp. 2P-4]
MTWLAWRQQRPVALALLALLGCYATLAVWERSTYPQMHGVTAGLSQYLSLFLGLFVGAPAVAREFELGTHRLVWTQTITRRHWYLTRLACATLISLVSVAMVTALVTWATQHPALWTAPDVDPLSPVYFDSHDLVPFTLALALVALGFATGVLFQKTVVSMGTVLVLWIAITSGGPALRTELQEADVLTGYWPWQFAYGGALILLAATLTLVGLRRLTRR